MEGLFSCCDWPFLAKFRVTIGFDDLRYDDLITGKPIFLSSLCLKVTGMINQYLKCFERAPVVHIGEETSLWILPSLLTKVTGDRLCDCSNFLIQSVDASSNCFLAKMNVEEYMGFAPFVAFGRR
nr:hypothetical protein [uncultured Pseudomonas sp.]